MARVANAAVLETQQMPSGGGRDNALLCVEEAHSFDPFSDSHTTVSTSGMDMRPAPLSEEATAFLRRNVNIAQSPCTSDPATELLVRENELLRGQVADLTGALKARDMEITALRERCQYLMKAIDQQDETIAKIYAVASPATTKDPSQPVVAPVKPKNASPVKKTKDATTPFSASAPNSLGGLLSEAIERILNPPSLLSPSGKAPKSAPVAAAVSTTSSRQPQRQMSLFDDDTASTTTTDTSPSSCSSVLSKSSSTRSFDRRESCASEEDFVKSAGFLRRPSRRASGRLSISDFGLLDDDVNAEDDVDNQRDDDGDDVDCQGEGEEETPPEATAAADKRVLSRSKSADFHQKRSRSASSLSQRNLFAGIDEVNSKSKSKAKKQVSNQEELAEQEEQELTYAEFLERLRLPASRDIQETIRMFLASILGPRGDGKPPRSTDFVDYDFYGTHELRRRLIYFFQSIDEVLLNHPLWSHTSEATLSKARDWVEKYVMDKLQDITMNQLDECAHWKEEDERLLTRMKLLSFITPDMLDIKPCMRNEVVWSMAEDELRRINSFRSPGDKINCIVRCCSIIFSVLNLTRGDAGSRPGADDFLPVFIYIVLHSKIPRLYSNCEYISAYRNPNDLMSKAGYCFVNLRSALEFLSVVDASMLSINEDEFTRLYQQEERKLL